MSSGMGSRRSSFSLLDKLEVEEEERQLRQLRELRDNDEGGEHDDEDVDEEEDVDIEEGEEFDDDESTGEGEPHHGAPRRTSRRAYVEEQHVYGEDDMDDHDVDDDDDDFDDDEGEDGFVPMLLPGEYFLGSSLVGDSEPLLVVHEATEEDGTEFSIGGGLHDYDYDSLPPPSSLPGRQDFRETSINALEGSPLPETTAVTPALRPHNQQPPSLDPLYEDDEAHGSQRMMMTTTASSNLRGSFGRPSSAISAAPTPQDFAYYYEDGSSSMASGISSETSYIWGGGATGGHRRSFASFNTAGSGSEADGASLYSAASSAGGGPPNNNGANLASGRREATRISFSNRSSSDSQPVASAALKAGATASPVKQQRRVTISVPKEPTDASSAGVGSESPAVKRRTSRYRYSRAGFLAGTAPSSDEMSVSSANAGGGAASSSYGVPSSPGIFRTPVVGRSVLGRRTSSQLRSSGTGSADSSSGGNRDSFLSTLTPGGLAAAADRLTENHSAWESAAAAASIVAASHVQFGTDDWVLVLLNLLNIMNQIDDRSCFTVDPVNAFGYPAGEGKSEEERQGPFSYVLCVVREVHFDEDERYCKFDTND
jgi:DNA-directed RNA polymerase subunit delta